MPIRSVTIYHNPRCSKSRATLALLENADADPELPALEVEIIRYLETPPGADTIAELANMLSCPVKDLVRTSDASFKELGINRDSLSDAGAIRLLVENPTLLQRPIVVAGESAVIGRPPENIYSIV